MRKRYKMGLIVIITLMVLTVLVGIIKIFLPKEEAKPINITNVISSITDYNYTLDDRDSVYMKEVFKELETILNAENINYEDYAKTLTKLFIIDFYTLNCKINKYDVGSLEYILNDKVEMFKSKAMDNIYEDIVDNTYKNRIQNLPEVTNVNILSIEKAKYTLNNEEKDAYKLTFDIAYKEDLGYDKEGTVYMIQNNKKLEIVSYEPKIETE